MNYSSTSNKNTGWLLGGGAAILGVIAVSCCCLLMVGGGLYVFLRTDDLAGNPPAVAPVVIPATPAPPAEPQPIEPQSPIQQPPDAPQPTEPSPGERAVEPLPGAATGEDVVVGQVRWRLLSALDLGNTVPPPDEFTDPLTTEGRFIQLTFEVENQGSAVINFEETAVSIADGQGRTFIPSTDAEAYIETNERCFLEPLEPAQPLTCTEIYELPLDAMNLQFRVNDLSLESGQEAAIDLGL